MSQVVTGNTAKTEPENRAFYPALDGLRAVAFFMVFLEHYGQFPWGWAGVDLFFVLSGFLITGILFDSRNDTYRVRNFYVRRTLRIFPLYYGILLLVLFLWPLAHWQLSWAWAVWPAYLGNFARFVHPYALFSPAQRIADFQPTGVLAGHPLTLYLGHFWSLCVEEQFYLVWPWVVFWIRDRRKLMWCCGVTLAVCLPLRLLGQHLLPLWMLDNEVLYRFTPLRLDALLLGGLIALVLRGPSATNLLRYARRLTPLCLAAAAYLLTAFLYQHLRHRMPTYPEWKFTWGLALVDLLAALILLIAIQPGTIVYRALNRPILRWVGRISYGAYVWHDIPHALYFSLAQRIWPSHYKALVPMLGLCGTFVLASLSFRLLEAPFLNLKEGWTIGGRAATSSPSHPA
jgi:peptidoglycan/LPS O-acetylase OafA/YrhL